MAISRIGGKALRANLERDSDLAFNTNTLVIDYTNARIGIGLSSPTNTLSVTGSANVDNIKIDGNAITSTNANGNITISPNGSGSIDVDTSQIVNLTDPTGAQHAATKAYVDAQTSSGTNAGTVTLTATNTTDATHFPLFVDSATGNEASRTDTGFTYNPNSGTLASTLFAGTISTAAQTNITSLGTLTALQVDNININGNTLSSTAGTDLLITPLAGQQIVLDGAIVIDAGVVTGATSITSTAFVGNVTGNTSGTAATVTTAAQSAITSLGTLTALQVDNININGNTLSSTAGTDLLITPLAGQQIVLDGAIVIDAGVVTGATSITSTAFVGDITGNVTGNTSGTAATVTGAAQTAITSVGTLTGLVIANDGNIGSAGDSDSIAISASGVVTFSQVPLFPNNTIETADIQDNAVTLAKMAGIARGKIIYGDTSGNPAVLAPGTNAQILSTDGTDLTWTDISVSSLAADNLTAGDAAVLLTTSSGNITIDAAADDSDIILKGTDGTVDTTYLTIDGSAAGLATFNSGITLGGNIIIPDAGTIGSVTDTDAIAISSGGVVTMNQIPVFSAGINVSGGTIAGTIATAAQGNITSVGTLTALQVDNININGNAITSTAGTDLTITPLAGQQIVLDGAIVVDAGVVTGATSITSTAFVGDVTGDVTGNTSGTAATVTTAAQTAITSVGTLTALQVDNININGNTLSSTAGTDLLITPLAGQQIVLDGAIVVDAGVVTGATSITSTAFVGDITGDVTGNTSGTAATVTGAAQTAITSVGTLGALVIVNGGNIGSAGDTDAIAIASDGDVTFSQAVTISGNLTINGTTVTASSTNTTIEDTLLELNAGAGSNANDMGIIMERGSTGNNAIMAWDESEDKFIMGTTTAVASATGNLVITKGTLQANIEGNVTGNTSGTAATVTTAAQPAITSVGTLTALQVDNLNLNGNAITSTAGTDLLITPLAGQQIVLDGAIIIDAGVVTGATSITSTAFVGDVTGNTSGSSGSTTGNAATATALATARTIGGVSFDGTGNINLPGVNTTGNQDTSGTAATVTTAAQTAITSVGTLTALQVDNININGNAITSTAGIDLLITPLAGQQIVLDGAIVIDAGVVTGATSITSTAFVGDITGNVTGNTSGTSGSTTGNAATATALATARTIGGVSFDGTGNINLPGVNTTGNQDTSGTAAVATVATTVTITDNESTDESNAIIFTAGGDIDGGNVGLESDGTLTYNPSTGKITATGFVGTLTGNVTGNTSGTAATVTTAAQTSITSLGTLTALQVDNININGNAITSTAGTDLLITPLAGQQIVLDGTIVIDAGVVTGATSITSTAFVGNVTGNTSGTAATVTTAAQTNITSVGILTALQVDNLNINGNTLSSTAGTDLLITPLAGQQIVLDGTIVIDAGVVTGATSITSTAFVGDITGDVTGNADTATALATARTIAGQSFDGTGNIAIAPTDLTGVTATATELNYVDNVTSAIQTQLNAKAPLAAPEFTGNATGVNLTLSGDLTINGTTTTVATTNMVVSDKLIELANGVTGTPSGDLGIVMERGDSTNAFMGFDESADKFIVGTGTFTGATTGDLTIATGTLVANIEGNVTGNTSGSSGSTTGNAATATALATARTIGGVSFDGTGNINLPGVNTTGNQDTSGTAATVTTAAQTAITSVGTLTTLTVDNIIVNGSNIGHTSDTDAIAISSGGVVTMNQIPVFSAGINVSGGTIAGTLATVAQTNITSVGILTALQVDNININGNTLSSTAGTDLLITPLAGQQIVLDGAIIIDAGVVTGATSITSTAFVGDITGDVTGTADVATVATTVTITDNESTSENNVLVFVAGADSDGGNVGLESDGTLTYNPSTGKITATGFVGTLTGNVTGNTSGTAATVTTAAQTAITSLGTLTALQVDNININGNAITSTAGTDLTITPLAGQQIVLDGAIVIDAGVVTGATSITSTAFVGDITGDVTGNTSGTAATVTTAAQTNITSVGTLTALQVDNLNINGNTLSSTAGTDLLITPLAGQQIVLDGAIVIDAGVVTGATSITSTAFVGDITGDVTGNTSGTAATVTTAAQTAITSLGTLTALQVDNININGNGITSTAGTDLTITPLAGQQIVLDGAIVIDAGVVTGATSITSTAFVGDITGDVTGNTSGTAATVTTAAQTAITSLGTLTALQVDNININGNTLSSTAGTDLLITPLAGQQIVLDGAIVVDAGVVTGATSITSTAFVGDVTGDVTGNTSGSSGSTTGNAATATALATARTIAGQSFDGTGNIAIAPTDLTGVTATATELNYVDNVTSAIQTQLNAKAPLAAPAFTGNATGVNLTLSGDLTINGTTTTVSTTNMVVSDKLIELANGATGTPTGDLGIVMERGDSNNAFMGFDESTDKFIVGTGTFTGATTGDLTIATGTLVANIEGNVTGNTSGTAATVTTAAQTNITSLGTLTALQVDNININGNTLSSTAGTDLLITPLAGQQIVLDGAIIIDAGVVTGATSITSTAFVGDITGDVTGNTSGTAATVTTAAQTAITSVGTLTTLTVDNIIVNGSNIGHTSDTDAIAISSGGVVTMNQIPVFSAGINVSGGTIAGTLATAAQTAITSVGTLTALQVDNLNLNGNAITSTAGTDLLITPLAGQQIVLDGTIVIDAGIVTGATSITSTAFVGDITGDVTGTADVATVATTVTITDNESTDESNAIIFTAGGDIDGGNVGLESDGTLTYNPSTGKITATGFVGTLTGNVTGNTSGTAATVTTAAQTAITSVGTLTALQVDNININGNAITSTAGTDLTITPLAGQQIVLDGAIVIDAGVVTGATSITSTAFVGALTGNASGTAATVTGAAQAAITTVGTLNGLAIASSQTITIGSNRITNVADPVGSQDAVTKSWAEANLSGGGGSSGFSNSTFTTAPGSDGNFDLAKQQNQTGSVETPFESGGADSFGVNLGEIYDQMEPVGSISAVDLGVLS